MGTIAKKQGNGEHGLLCLCEIAGLGILVLFKHMLLALHTQCPAGVSDKSFQRLFQLQIEEVICYFNNKSWVLKPLSTEIVSVCPLI